MAAGSPAVHAAKNVMTAHNTWMPGTSPGMTSWDFQIRAKRRASERQLVRTRSKATARGKGFPAKTLRDLPVGQISVKHPLQKYSDFPKTQISL
jgi:hypothetical protein